MFTSGRIAFLIFFLLVFGLSLVYAYRKDIKKNPKYFKGSYKVILALIVIYSLYFALTRIVH